MLSPLLQVWILMLWPPQLWWQFAYWGGGAGNMTVNHRRLWQDGGWLRSYFIYFHQAIDDIDVMHCGTPNQRQGDFFNKALDRYTSADYMFHIL